MTKHVSVTKNILSKSNCLGLVDLQHQNTSLLVISIDPVNLFRVNIQLIFNNNGPHGRPSHPPHHPHAAHDKYVGYDCEEVDFKLEIFRRLQ